jgi:hypothetical protein
MAGMLVHPDSTSDLHVSPWAHDLTATVSACAELRMTIVAQLGHYASSLRSSELAMSALAEQTLDACQVSVVFPAVPTHSEPTPVTALTGPLPQHEDSDTAIQLCHDVCLFFTCALWAGLQLRDPYCSPPLTSCTVAQVVHRYNSCLPHRGLCGASGWDPATMECELLERIAMEAVNKYPRAPTRDQRCSLVSLAAMNDSKIQVAVVNAICECIKSATAVSDSL